MSVTYKFRLPGITCVNCVAPIEKSLSSCKRYSIESYRVDLLTKIVVITVGGHDTPRDDVKQYFKTMMNDLAVDSEEINVEVKAQSRLEKVRSFFLSHWFQGALGALLGAALLILSLVTGGLPLAAMIAIGAISTVLTFLLGAQSFYHAGRKLIKARLLTMDTLFSISTLTVLVVSLAAFFIPWLPMMFSAGLLIFGFRHIGLAIAESVKRKMKLDKTFQQLLPFETRVLNEEGHVETRAVGVIAIDDVLVIHAGETIPVDGICLSEEGLIYDTIKTGAPLPRLLNKGELLISGMRLAEGSPPIHLKASTTAADSYLARLDKNIEKAHCEKAPIEEAAKRILQYFIPAAIGFAILFGVLIGVFFSAAIALPFVAGWLVSLCPCTLGLVVPLAVKAGVQKGAENGVQFKSAKALQAANTIDVVVFDLNGTLTTGVPTVCRKGVCQLEMDEQILLAYAAAIEKNSPHAMAKAICEEAKLKQTSPVTLPENSTIDSTHHSGVRATINDELWVLGNEAIMQESGVNLSSIKDSLKLAVGESVVYIARQQQLLGYFVLSDPLRKDARQSVSALQKLGKQVHLCTGSDEHTARRYASLLGISNSNIAASCVGMGEEFNDNSKTAYINKLRSRGLKVAMVGDAANDALAIARSNFGIAIKSHSGSEMTQQEAGAVIQGGSLLPVANAFAVAQQTVNNIKQNLSVSLAYNMVVMVLAGGLLFGLGIILNPGVMVALMIVQTLFILGNAYRLRVSSLPRFTETSSKGNRSSTNSYQYFQEKMHSNRASARVGSHVDEDSTCSASSGMFSKKRKNEPSPTEPQNDVPQFSS